MRVSEDKLEIAGELFHEVLVLGAGPTGLWAIFELGMLGIKAALMDCLPAIGGQCSALYPEKFIYDIPAQPKISGQRLTDTLWEQAMPFGPELILGHKAVKIEKYQADTGLFQITTDKNLTIIAKSIIIAIGGGAFAPNKPPIEGIEFFEGKSVFYAIKNTQNFDNANIVIAGGGDSAIDWALILAETARKIYLVHRRNNFRAAPHSLHLLGQLRESGKVELVAPYQLHNLEGSRETGRLTGVSVIDLDGQTLRLEADFLLPFFGLAMDHDYLSGWGLTLSADARQIVVNRETMQSSVEGVYVIGDAAFYQGKHKLISVGFGEGSQAARAIFSYLYPERTLHAEHSTSKGVPTGK